MDKIIEFETHDFTEDLCAGNVYLDFLDYAFKQSDYFMLVYVNYYDNGFSCEMERFKELLSPFEVKTRTDPFWPGIDLVFSLKTTYQVVFYKNVFEAKSVLAQVNKLSDWSFPNMPQDLAFFKGNQCWFYSVGHEKIATIIHTTEDDFDFLESHGLAQRADAFYAPDPDYYTVYDEIIE